jgi:DNA-binding GntR family transcriptional regulator
VVELETRQHGVKWRSRVRLVDEVADVLRERIYEGHYALGTPLRQEQLAAELDVSRTPLREALRMLEQEGLVTVLPGRGVRVIPADRWRLLDAYRLREVVDGLAARLAADHVDRTLSGRFDEILARQLDAVTDWDAAGYTAANVEFHTEVVRAARNGYVEAQLPLIRMTSQVFTPMKLVDRQRAEQAVQEHRAIVGAISAGEAGRAEELARLHIQHTIASLSAQAFDEEPPDDSDASEREEPSE